MSDSLLSRYDALLLDLDGTVYRGGEAVPGAAEAIEAAHSAGVGVRFVTNNATRRPADVAAQLNGMGIPATADEVTTSAQAGAGLLVDRVAPGSEVLVLGTDALVAEVGARGFSPVDKAGPDVRAVVQGLSQDIGWHELAEATVAIRAGAVWVATNADATLPTERGLLPGNGALVAAVRAATGAEPLVAGKPERPLMADAIRASSARHPLAVGDRLDTDVAGAVTVGIDSLLVLTGVSTAAGLLAAGPECRPTYVAADLGGLRESDPRIGEQADWQVDGVTLRHTGDGTPDPITALRALCAAWWADGRDSAGIKAGDDAAAEVVRTLGLPTAS
jgi:HAD superfamily hydrolase (TIGR01450 family)